jgi:hypothetical protein
MKMPAALRATCRLYGWMLLLYPLTLRSRFGPEMSDVFAQQLRDAWQLHGFSGLAKVWSCAAEELILVALPARFNPGILRIGAISLLSTLAVFYFVLWGVTPPIHLK